jgi:hypothetical protein
LRSSKTTHQLCQPNSLPCEFTLVSNVNFSPLNRS